MANCLIHGAVWCTCKPPLDLDATRRAAGAEKAAGHDVCEHGCLRRQCNLCEVIDERNECAADRDAWKLRAETVESAREVLADDRDAWKARADEMRRDRDECRHALACACGSRAHVERECDWLLSVVEAGREMYEGASLHRRLNRDSWNEAAHEGDRLRALLARARAFVDGDATRAYVEASGFSGSGGVSAKEYAARALLAEIDEALR